MPVETAMQRLRRLAGLPPANDFDDVSGGSGSTAPLRPRTAAADATALAPKPKPRPLFQPHVDALPEDQDALRRTDSQEDKARGAKLRVQDFYERQRHPDWNPPNDDAPNFRDVSSGATSTAKSPSHLVMLASQERGRAATDATSKYVAPPLKPRTWESRDAFRGGDEADPDELRGFQDRKERAAPYAPDAMSRAKLLSVGAHVGSEAEFAGKRQTPLGEGILRAANSATGGITGRFDGIDDWEKQRADRVAAGTNVTPQELRDSGAIGQDDLSPRLIGNERTGSIMGGDMNSRQMLGMAGDLAGFGIGIGAQNKLIGKMLTRVPEAATGFNRVDRAAQGFVRKARFDAPQTLRGQVAKSVGEFALPSAGMDANRAQQNNENVLDAVVEGQAHSAAMGAGFPIAGKLAHEAMAAGRVGMAKLATIYHQVTGHVDAFETKDAAPESKIEMAPQPTIPSPIDDVARPGMAKLKELAGTKVGKAAMIGGGLAAAAKYGAPAEETDEDKAANKTRMQNVLGLGMMGTLALGGHEDARKLLGEHAEVKRQIDEWNQNPANNGPRPSAPPGSSRAERDAFHVQRRQSERASLDIVRALKLKEEALRNRLNQISPHILEQVKKNGSKYALAAAVGGGALAANANASEEDKTRMQNVLGMGALAAGTLVSHGHEELGHTWEHDNWKIQKNAHDKFDLYNGDNIHITTFPSFEQAKLAIDPPEMQTRGGTGYSKGSMLHNPEWDYEEAHKAGNISNEEHDVLKAGWKFDVQHDGTTHIISPHGQLLGIKPTLGSAMKDVIAGAPAKLEDKWAIKASGGLNDLYDEKGKYVKSFADWDDAEAFAKKRGKEVIAAPENKRAPSPRMGMGLLGRSVKEQVWRYQQAGMHTAAFNLEKHMDGAAVDRPLIHATKTDFDTFKHGELGFHLTPDPAAAEKRLPWYSKTQSIGHTMPLWANMKNPIRLSDPGEWNASILHELHSNGVISQDEMKETADKVLANMTSDDNRVHPEQTHAARSYRWTKPIRDLLKSKGHDGIVYENKFEGGGDSYIAFDPEQLKSATGNNGDFNPKVAAIAGGAALGARLLSKDDGPASPDEKKHAQLLQGLALAMGTLVTHGRLEEGPGLAHALEGRLHEITSEFRELHETVGPHAQEGLERIVNEERAKLEGAKSYETELPKAKNRKSNKPKIAPLVALREAGFGRYANTLEQMKKEYAERSTELLAKARDLKERIEKAKEALPPEDINMAKKGAIAVGAGVAANKLANDDDGDKKLPAAALAMGALELSRGHLKLESGGEAPKIERGFVQRGVEKEFTGNDVIIGRHEAANDMPAHEKMAELARAATDPKEKALLQTLATAGKTAFDKAWNDGADIDAAEKTALTAVRKAANEVTSPFDKARLVSSGVTQVLNDTGKFEPVDMSVSDVRFALEKARAALTEAKQNREPRTELKQKTVALRRILNNMKEGDDFQTAAQKLSVYERALAVKGLPGAVLRSRTGEPLAENARVRGTDFQGVPDDMAQRIFDGHSLYSNPMFDPAALVALAKAHPTLFHGAALAGLGYGAQQVGDAEDNEKLKWSGMGIMALGALHAVAAHPVRGGEFGSKALEYVGAKVRDGIKDEKFGSLKGSDILNWISHDILATPELKAAANEYERNVARGAARAAEYQAKMRRLGPIGERLASDLIDQEAWEKEAAKLSPDELKSVLAAAQALMNEFHDIGQEEVNLGTMEKGQFDKYDGQYIPRLFATHEADAARGVGDGPQATNKPKLQKHQTRDMTLPRNVRENMGQIRESGYLAQKGIAKGYRNIAAARLFSALSAMPGVLSPDYQTAVQDLLNATKGGNPKTIRMAKQALDAVRGREAGGYGGYKTLSTSKGYGVLAGAVVRKDVAAYLEGLPHFGDKSLANDLFQSWKKIHTVWNPGTHLGNFVSNITTVHMKGLPIHEVPGALIKAGKAINAYDRDVRDLAEAGVMDNNIATMDYTGNMLPPARSKIEGLRELADRTTPVTKSILAQREIEPHSNLSLAAGKVNSKMEKYYNLEDNWFRVALYKKAIAAERDGGLGMTRPQGIEYTRYHMGDFRTRSKALALARWYSPFIMYPAKMLPHMVGSIVEHPWRWLTLAAGWGAVDQLSAYSQGQGALPSIDDKGLHLGDVKRRIKTGGIDPMDMNEDERPSRGFGYLIPGPIQAPFSRGKAKFAEDISRWTPFSALSGQPSPGSLAAAASSRIPAIVSPGGPLGDLFARTQVNKDPYTGEDWIHSGESTGAKTGKIAMGLIGNQVLPSALAWHAPRLIHDVLDKSYDKAGIDALGFAGMRPRTVIPGQRLQQDKYWLQDENEAAARELKKRRRETKDPDRLKQALQEFRDRKARVAAEFKRRNTRPK